MPSDHPAPELVRDEQAILAIVKEVFSRYNINREAVMITGWSAGAFMAHYIGMRHPDIFRCIVARCGNFNEHLVTDDVALKARHMHVYCFFGEADWPGFSGQSRDAQTWYTLRGFRNFEIRAMPGGHDPNQTEAAGTSSASSTTGPPFTWRPPRPRATRRWPSRSVPASTFRIRPTAAWTPSFGISATRTSRPGRRSPIPLSSRARTTSS